MFAEKIEDYILYEDKEIIVCHKPAGIAVQNARIGALDMESAVKNYLALKMKNLRSVPYLGVVHRLDQPVEGIIVFAKTPKAAKELSRQMTAGEMKKTYLAVTESCSSRKLETLQDWLKKDGRTNTSAVVKEGTQGAKKARLSYEIVEEHEMQEKRYLVRIQLETGRHHQIRVQMAHHGMPLLGDRKYNPDGKHQLPLALCAAELTFRHPVTKKVMEFQVNPKGEAFKEFSVR